MGTSTEDRIRGGLYGMLIGDAVGVPYEFHGPAALPHQDALDIVPPVGFVRAHPGVPPGTWSDDGAQALVLLASLLDREALDLDDFGRRLVNWADFGYFAVDNEVFDIGVQTAQALQTIRTGTPAASAGSADVYANGNGALMRCLPLALWHKGTDEDLVSDAHSQGLPTHGHPRSQACCALYLLWARGELQGKEGALDWARRRLRDIYGDFPLHREELESYVDPLDREGPARGTGYVVDCLRSAIVACEAEHFGDVIRRAIAFGHDTDTTACVAGGIAGIRWGEQGISERWRAQLRGKELVEPLLQQLLAARGSL